MGVKSVPLDANFSYEKSKFGNQSPSRFKIISGVPTTFSSSGDGNGAVLKINYLRILEIEMKTGIRFLEQLE